MKRRISSQFCVTTTDSSLSVAVPGIPGREVGRAARSSREAAQRVRRRRGARRRAPRAASSTPGGWRRGGRCTRPRRRRRGGAGRSRPSRSVDDAAARVVRGRARPGSARCVMSMPKREAALVDGAGSASRTKSGVAVGDVEVDATRSRAPSSRCRSRAPRCRAARARRAGRSAP